jgi:hypothetical protein
MRQGSRRGQRLAASARPLPTHHASRIAGDARLAPCHAEGVEPQEAPFERLSGAGQELHDLHRLHAADDPDERRGDAGVRTALGGARRCRNNRMLSCLQIYSTPDKLYVIY